ncbi:PREDICTED: gem-associated protein 5-like [Papilio xuthus]|uniref:Gem-associated protein 5-like n=1 Tax=Papilio xuthus TaxID=66420 RepID=A0AAJ6YYT7_PAPXU|nr:PREDICTED: gem-associated protein 5-like [Papilio xuthus]
MEETVVFPSPNWFQTTGLAVSTDRWFVFGGPQKSLCVLEPIPDSLGIVKGDVYRAHVLLKAHFEKVVSVDISPEWPEKKAFMSGSVDGCVKCWVLELADNKYKLNTTHSHSVHKNEKEEVVGVGYCNETYAVTVGSMGYVVKWDLNSNVIKTYRNFLKTFRPTSMACSPHVPLNLAIGTKQGVIFVVDLTSAGKILYKVRGQDDEIVSVSWCPQFEVSIKQTLDIDKKVSANERMNKIRLEAEHSKQNMNNSGVSKTLPDDSFDESIVQEDDLFDMYKDYETDAFGPKKYEPEDILVRVKAEVKTEVSYLDECKILTEEILKRKNQPEESIAGLVDALENVAVDKEIDSSNDELKAHDDDKEAKEDSTKTVSNQHKHLVSSLGKNGCVRIWASGGKLVGSCNAPISSNKNQKNIKIQQCTTLLWCKPDTLLIADGRSQLLHCNPLKIDGKNKMVYKFLHSQHRRGLFSIVSDAPRVQTSENLKEAENWSVWTTAQDRNVIRCSLGTEEVVYTHATCGGFIYNVQPCPYDARRVAVSSGDGVIRVLELDVADDDEMKLYLGNITTYWQNVQGKVLTVAWHPTKENLLAFGTAEARVGLIDANGKSDRPARTLLPALGGGVYSLCWGEDDQLLAAANGELVVYRTSKPDQPPQSIKMCVEGAQWAVSCVRAQAQSGLLAVGSCDGAVAVTRAAPHCTALAANYLYTKMIYNVEWHPEQTSEANEESPYKNLIAVSSLDKQHSISILEYGDKEDGTKQLQVWKVLTGHKHAILQLAWSPHRDELLASTSQDCTIRVWDVVGDACVSICNAHTQYAVGVAWCARPQFPAHLLTGGADCSLRLWSYMDYSAVKYQGEEIGVSKRDKKKLSKQVKKAEDFKYELLDSLAVAQEDKVKTTKKYLLPLIHKQMQTSLLSGAKRMLKNHINKNSDDNKIEKDESENLESKVNSSLDKAELDKEPSNNDKGFDIDFIKMFGSTNDVNEVLDLELENHRTGGNLESCIMLCVLRGRIDCAVQFAVKRDLLCPYLLSLTPCVSHKYWKEVMQLYTAQLDRLIAKGEEEKYNLSRKYGGPVYRKLGALLSAHDLKAAVALLAEHRLYREAYVLCRTRHMDSIATDVLGLWAQHSVKGGKWAIAAVCHLAMGDLSQAAMFMGKSSEPEFLCLAAEMAKLTGQTTFADHIEERKSNIIKEKPVTENEDSLDELPTRMELLLKEETSTKKEEIRDQETVEQSDMDLPSRMEQLLRDVQKEELNGTEVKTESQTDGEMEKLPSKMELLLKEYATGSQEKESNQSHEN